MIDTILLAFFLLGVVSAAMVILLTAAVSIEHFDDENHKEVENDGRSKNGIGDEYYD